MSKPKFVYVIYIASTPDKVFKALTDPRSSGASYWFGNAVTSDWKVGSPFAFHGRQADHEGKMLENDPPRRLVLHVPSHA